MPTDDIATILAQVREWELVAHNASSKFAGAGEIDAGVYWKAKEESYKRVADYIESNPKQLHRRLDGQ